MQKTKKEIFANIYSKMGNGIRSVKSLEARKWLKVKGLSIESSLAVFNSGQMHHRKPGAFIDELKSIGLLKESKVPVKSPELKAYTCFGRYSIIFPLKDKQGDIVNLYAVRIKTQTEKDEYLNTEGIYPGYPGPLTRKLYICSTIIDTASFLESKVMENREAVISLFNGELKTQHFLCIEKLKQLEEIVFIGGEIPGEIIKELPPVYVSRIKIHGGEDLNRTWVRYGQARILKLLQETKPILNGAFLKEPQPNQQEKKSIAVSSFKLPGEVLKDEPVNTLHTTKSDLVVYNGQKIGFPGKAGQYYILGALPGELGSLGITLQLEEPGTGRKHTRKLDLFENEQVQNYCVELSEKEGFNANLLEADLLELCDLLSAYRDKQIEKSTSGIIGNRVQHTLSQEKEKLAVQFLSGPKLMQRTDDLIAKSGVIGEENNRVLLYLCASSFKTNPLHVLVQGSSGSGKSHLINIIKDCLPPGEVINLTRVTSKSFYHYQDEELVNKLIVIQDFDGLDKEAQLAFREAQSAKNLSSSIVFKDKFGNLQSLVRTVKAHFSSMVATTKAEVYYDNMSRSVIIGVDESEEQTRKIIHYQNRKIAGLVDLDKEQQARELLQNCVQVLRPYKVLNRFADKISLPVEAKMLRRLNEQFQQFVIQVAFFHQYQRQIDKESRIIATPGDLKIAAELFFDAIWLKVDDLDSSTRQFFERLKAYLKIQGASKNFSQREIRQVLNQSKSQCFRYMGELLRLEYVSVIEGTANRGFKYKISFWDELEKHRSRIKTGLLNQINKL